MIAALVVADMHRAWRVPQWLERGGDSSYCIYLLHWLWIYHLRSMLSLSPLVEVGIIIVIVVMTLVSSELLHRFYERPILRFGKRFLK